MLCVKDAGTTESEIHPEFKCTFFGSTKGETEPLLRKQSRFE